MINNTNINYHIFSKRWKPAHINYIKKSFTARYQSALIKDILQNNHNIYIYSIADLGCGVGHNTAMLAEMFPQAKVDGFDFTHTGISVAKSTYKHSNLSFYVKDITKENIGEYDFISMFEVLEHIENWQLFLEQLVTNVNKYLMLSFPTGRMRDYEIPGGHLRNFKKNEVETFLYQLGFKPITVYYAGFPFFSPIFRNVCGWFPNLYNKAKDCVLSKKLEYAHLIFYFLGRYCSTRRQLGDQFVGLFERINTK